MNCLICRQAETVDGFTSVTFEREEIRLVVNKVPARVCLSCGEAYVEETVALRLLQEADAMSDVGTFDDVLDYSAIQSTK